ncbi:MAG: hypothetical protein QOJ63_3184, partial [Solirubrobacteraceae bacterium]|nr:hypothetical protein [Solirubrobacteraceae bacterium]
MRRRGRQPTPGLNDLLLDYHTTNATGSSDSDHRHLHDGPVAFRLAASHRGSSSGTYPGAMGANCTHRRYDAQVPKVIQIRDVPDDVRDALA